MKKIQYLFLSLLFVSFFYACDKVEPPYCDEIVINNNPDTNTTDIKFDGYRKVLLEEYTGHKCPNCVEGAKIAHDLKVLYDSSVVLMTVHAGTYFADPDPYGIYTYDFRTTTGTDWDNEFKVSHAGLPGGMINRHDTTGSIILNKDNWATAISLIIEKDQEADMVIKNEYNETTRELKVSVYMEFMKQNTRIDNSISTNYMLGLYLLEDSIIKPQKDNALGDISAYTHMHVLREPINSTWGTAINAAYAGITYSQTHTITLDSEYDDKNCSIVGFIYRYDDKKIVQAEGVHVE